MEKNSFFPSSLSLSNIESYGVYLSRGSLSGSVGFSVSAAGKMIDSQYDGVAVSTFYQNTEAKVSVVYGDSGSASSTPTMTPTLVGTTVIPTLMPTTASTNDPTITPVFNPTHEPTFMITSIPTSNITTGDAASSQNNGLSLGAVVGISVGIVGGICYFAYPYLKHIIDHASTETVTGANNEISMNVIHTVAGEVVADGV